MALAVLFVSVGWDVKFHYCTEDHSLTGSFSNAASECVHCLEHHHEHEAEQKSACDVLHFDAKCCCEDFDSKIEFTDNYVFSPDKQTVISLQSFVLPLFEEPDLFVQEVEGFNHHSQRKTLKFLSGRERLISFSSLKLNPLVF